MATTKKVRNTYFVQDGAIYHRAARVHLPKLCKGVMQYELPANPTQAQLEAKCKELNAGY